MKKSNLSKIGLAAALALTGLAQIAPATASVKESQTATQARTGKEAINQVSQLPTNVMQVRQGLFSSFGNAGGKSRFLNQRQYRKMVRQNPHLKKSKKHRSKN